ncbi:MAG: PEP-CTERM sorting domain-containing protein [Bradymonadales bacterium]|nr:PEP-CTERM sorting domain-containing protein [Bradymonadales bacterium]
MKGTLFLAILLLLLLVVPLVVVAGPPPPVGPSGGEAGVSPEPLTTLLLAIGAVPTYLVYRRCRRTSSPEPGSRPD